MQSIHYHPAQELDYQSLGYVLCLIKINRSLMNTLKIYGNLLRKARFEDERQEDIQFAINQLENVLKLAEDYDINCAVTRH